MDSGGGSELGFFSVPFKYPSSPLAPSSWLILIFHWRRLSPLNFCSSERIVSDSVPDIIGVAQVVCCVWSGYMITLIN